jgi:hypothetical protein
MLRERTAQLGMNGFGIEIFDTAMRHDIAREVTVGRALSARDYNSIGSPGHAFQRGLDFARFDTEAADLQLLVTPAEEFDSSAPVQPTEIASPIDEAPIRREANEACRGLLGSVEIATGERLTCDDDLTNHAGRRWPQAFVDDEYGGPVDRPTDRRQRGPFPCWARRLSRSRTALGHRDAGRFFMALRRCGLGSDGHHHSSLVWPAGGPLAHFSGLTAGSAVMLAMPRTVLIGVRTYTGLTVLYDDDTPLRLMTISASSACRGP